MLTWNQLLRTVICLSTVAWAVPTYALPVISIIPEVAAGFEVDVIRPIPDFDHMQNQPGPVMVRVNFFLEILDLAGPPNEVGFSNAALRINFDGLERAQTPYPRGYICNYPLYDHDGDGGLITPPIPWLPFCDSTDNLRDIFVQGPTSVFGPESMDPRRRIGQDGPFHVGSVFLLWDGIGPDYVSTELGDSIGSYYDAEGTSHPLPPSQGVVGTVRLGQIPEPGAGAMLGVGATILFVPRRRVRMRCSARESLSDRAIFQM